MDACRKATISHFSENPLAARSIDIMAMQSEMDNGIQNDLGIARCHTICIDIRRIIKSPPSVVARAMSSSDQSGTLAGIISLGFIY